MSEQLKFDPEDCEYCSGTAEEMEWFEDEGVWKCSVCGQPQ